MDVHKIQRSVVYNWEKISIVKISSRQINYDSVIQQNKQPTKRMQRTRPGLGTRFTIYCWVKKAGYKTVCTAWAHSYKNIHILQSKRTNDIYQNINIGHFNTVGRLLIRLSRPFFPTPIFCHEDFSRSHSGVFLASDRPAGSGPTVQTAYGGGFCWHVCAAFKGDRHSSCPLYTQTTQEPFSIWNVKTQVYHHKEQMKKYKSSL